MITFGTRVLVGAPMAHVEIKAFRFVVTGARVQTAKGCRHGDRRRFAFAFAFAFRSFALVGSITF